MKRPEQQFQKAAIQYLRAILPRDAVVFAVPNGGWRSKTEGAIMIGQGVVPGVADLILVHQGRCFGMEMKAEGNYQTPSQKTWQAAFEDAGGRYAVCRTMDDIDDTLSEWGVPVRVVSVRSAA